MQNVMDHGAVGDGVSDDTAAIQAALDCGPGGVYFPPGTYRLSAPLELNAGRILELDDNALVTANPTPTFKRLLHTVPGATGIEIYGGTFGTIGHGGECALTIDGANDMLIDGSAFQGSKWDGIWIGGPGHAPATGITIRNVSCRSNKRNGLSITYASRVLVENCAFEDNGGAEPSSGMDIEPNSGEDVEDVTILRCAFTRNLANGLYMHSGQGGRGYTFRVVDCSFTDNVKYGIIGNAIDGLYVEDSEIGGSSIGASIGGSGQGLTFCYNSITCPRSLILSGIHDPRVYNNHLGVDLELVGASGVQAVSGDVYMVSNVLNA